MATSSAILQLGQRIPYIAVFLVRILTPFVLMTTRAIRFVGRRRPGCIVSIRLVTVIAIVVDTARVITDSHVVVAA
jgi:hypothetical protein